MKNVLTYGYYVCVKIGTLRRVALGCAKGTLQDDPVRVSRFHTRTGVRYARRMSRSEPGCSKSSVF